MELRDEDWRRLAEMRSHFLASREHGRTSERSFRWRDARDLELYDATFGERIGWKWRAVLEELALYDDFTLAGPIVDWGCGTGVASRALLTRFAASHAREGSLAVHVWDRSPLARRFARERLERAFSHRSAPAGDTVAVREGGAAEGGEVRAPNVLVHEGLPPADADPHVVLVSHVLGELDGKGLEELAALVARSTWCAWVEPGDHDTSRRLSRVRDTLLSSFDVLAPCTHQARCGVLAAGLERHWCHHFARPPSEVFQSALWARFAKELGIDLRSLPYSYLVLRKRSRAPALGESEAHPPGRSRVLGRPRVTKGRVQLDNCDEHGVRTVSLLERDAPELFDRLADSAGERLVFRWQVSGDRVRPI